MPETLLTPQILAQHFHDKRSYYLGLGWDKSYCQIGFYGNNVRLACDTGAADYWFEMDGTITRRTCGVISKLIEFMFWGMEHDVASHNQCAMERQAVAA